MSMIQKDCSDFYEGCRSRAIMLALEEDRYTGDITTMATIEDGQKGSAVVRAKEDGVVAGLEAARQVFAACDPSLSVVLHCADGDRVKKGAVVMDVKGPLAPLLLGERTALNFMQRMSGIATRTREFVDRVAHTGASILDTRKTAPGLRYFDKDAVRIGGGVNHRFGLFDMILIKDNHSDASGGIGPALNRARMFREKHQLDVKIEAEVRSLDELSSALAARPDRILLDNFSLDLMREAVEYVHSMPSKVELEASGNMSLHNVREVAETGVDFISVGELTHSVRALDLSMTIDLG
ncbi:carboxylating nicotinate-nucleotide diphosphorylase [Chlorobium phaeovibrioides]|uniref:nicotinate-nucleotide diphosphorylase (carboxylating) n=1 Tax=Chlorobium phaeovibrioides TaxID=1094 RepID=A0ABW9UPS7_CHLPH|nr:carboxylating nicotinate-nucleotide diphosphorylase [Chlorobium phaeovibrioides]MWV55055.1 carboxylating nicotinate-nucleotide diphosphorylase [Chlorobium phaeovibrioides]QEQ57473.1 carboxylating nicotinate-nucleotide diphosphorylase [Chlorobium phaeovibrioides]RTY36097.1 carboxylating nicotinate-nucleotide diphosphorylase [Chlorobium phaeovibrioides]